jgi:hypothetical protein
MRFPFHERSAYSAADIATVHRRTASPARTPIHVAPPALREESEAPVRSDVDYLLTAAFDIDFVRAGTFLD